MANDKRFVIHEGVLIKYKGADIDPDFTFPEGIIGIGNNVFRYQLWNCDRLVIPETVQTIGNNAFADPIPGSSVKEIIIRGDIQEIGKGAFSWTEAQKIVFEGYVGKIGESAFSAPDIRSFSVAGGIDSIGKNAFAQCRNLKTIDTPWIGKIGKDAFEGCKKMDVEAVQALLNNKPAKAPARTVEKKPKQAKVKLTAAEEALCEPWRSVYDEKLLQKTFAKLKGTQELIADVKTADGAPAPGYLVQCAIVPYAELLKSRPKAISEYKTACYETELIREADKAAALLDRETLMEALKKLRAAGGAAWLIPYGRYAQTEQVKQLLSDMKAWENWGAFGGTGRGDIIIARGALLLSESREAMLYIDKVGQLEQYANIRGTDADTVRDTVLSEFGFDEDRKLSYDLGGNTVIVTIGEDLTLRLTDGATGKTVKSVPKKNADPELHKAAQTKISALKKDIKNVVTNRKKRLLAEYLSGAHRTVEDWQLLFVKNPVLNAVARLVVWSQGDKTFTVASDGAVDCNGDAYTFSDAPIRVAHPVEMPEQLRLWQDYFVSRGLKQPFEQVWEPAYQPDEIKADRYEGCKVSSYKVIDMETHGIHAYGFRYYSDDYGFTLSDCTLEYETPGNYYIPGEDSKLTLGKFSFEKMTRYVNHIVYLFDKWTATNRILADDVSVVTSFPAFTAAQIMEFINIAGENGSTNVLALLMEYKNTHFAKFDPMEAFTLDL